jgi:hypothetical protein
MTDFFHKYTNCARAILLLWLMIPLTLVLSGCKQVPLEYYENKEWNFSLKYPGNWEFNEDDRVENDFSLLAKKGLFHKSGAWIYISAWFPEDSPTDLETKIEHYIDVFAGEGKNIKSAEVVSISSIDSSDQYEMISATLSIPTLDIPEESYANQMGERGENVMQMVDIYILCNSQGQDISIKVYKGTDESLNEQADEIVQSIRFINE